jgi:tRNA pseudouridine38-40 synthase
LSQFVRKGANPIAHKVRKGASPISRTLKFTIAYDGTDFAGWQRQATDRTVQATIEDALLPIEGARAVLIGAGRTDAGVHAAAQVASVRLTATLTLDQLQRALNATLPPDVRILKIEDAPAAFNAQFAATHKTYRYFIWSGGVLPPQLRRCMWHVAQPLDVEAMDGAARTLVGTHDFSTFQAVGSDVQTTERTIVSSHVQTLDPASLEALSADPGGRAVVYEVTGTGFLRHMVRNIVGTLVDVGRRRRRVEDMPALVAGRDRARAAPSAPPHGLTLWRVDY